jgi:hypothetical protein
VDARRIGYGNLGFVPDGRADQPVCASTEEMDELDVSEVTQISWEDAESDEDCSFEKFVFGNC